MLLSLFAAAGLLVLVLVLAARSVHVQDAVFRAALAAQRRATGLVPGQTGELGRRIAYLERRPRAGAGAGAETIVLLHGFAANKDVWLPFARHLPARYRLLIIDLPGHGESDFDPEADYGPEGLTDGVARALERIAPGDFHLAGNSLGGLVATLLAARFPQRVATLGLIDSAGVYPPHPSEFQELLDAGDNPLLVSTREELEHLLDFVFHRRPWLPWPVGAVLARMHGTRAAIHRRIWDDLAAGFEEVTPLLRGLEMPVLVVWGENDRVLDVSSVTVYRECVPRIETVILPRCGHSPMVERASECALRYVSFCAGHAAGTGRGSPPAGT